MQKRKPVHPGYFFREEYLNELDLSVTDAARMLGITRKALSEFVDKKTSCSVNMAIRLGVATNTTPQSWLNMQQKLDLWEVQKSSFTVNSIISP